MRNYLLTLVVIFGLPQLVLATQTRPQSTELSCASSEPEIEKPSRLSPEVKPWMSTWKTSWSPFRQSKGKHCKTQKLRSCSATPATPSSLLHDRNNERANHYSADPDNSQLLQHAYMLCAAGSTRDNWRRCRA